MKEPLKIGLLTNGETVPLWAHLMISRIEEEGYGKTTIIIGCKKQQREKKGVFKKIKKAKSKILFFAYEFFDEKIFKSSPNAFEQKNIRTLLPDVPFLSVDPVQTKFTDRLGKEDLMKIEKHKIDIFIRLGFRILKGEILNLSKFGIWSYHHGDNSVNRGGPPGFWEIFYKWPVTGVTLQILNEELDGGEVIARLDSATHKYSVLRNKNNLYWGGVSLLPRKIKELSLKGEFSFFRKVKSNSLKPYCYSNPIFKAPSNGDVIKFCFRVFWRMITEKLNYLLYMEQWVLLYSFSKKNNGPSTSFNKFKFIIPPKDRFWADPHIIYHNDKYFLFIEELIYKSGKGHISVMELNELGEYSKPKVIIEKDYHMSYPNVFSYKGEYYMIPETSANRSVELYKCEEFPYRWVFVKKLFENITALDATIHFHDNMFWLFMNIRENSGASNRDELFLFHTEDFLNGDWVSYPDNPIVSDVQRSRPAGSLFSLNGELIRPAQNSAKRYGHGMTLNKVKELNSKNYEEVVVGQIFPDWNKNLVSTHTLSHSERLTVIDAQLKRRKVF